WDRCCRHGGNGAANFTMKDATIIEALQGYLPDADSTLRAGAALAPGLRGGMIVTLSGELGAGKTTLVRGMLRELGWLGAVKSPSYALVEDYTISSLYFYHFDFYRFEDSNEWDATGFAEYFRPDAICVRAPVAGAGIHAAHPRDAGADGASAAGNEKSRAPRARFGRRRAQSRNRAAAGARAGGRSVHPGDSRRDVPAGRAARGARSQD